MVTDSIAFLNPFCFEFRIKCNSLARIVCDFVTALDVAVEAFGLCFQGNKKQQKLLWRL